KTIETIGSDNLGICWDVGHLNLTKTYSVLETPEHFVEIAGKYIKALHIADNDGRTDQHLIPNVRFDKDGFSCDPTKINLCLITKLLKKIGYEGLYNFEVPGEIKAPLEIRKKKMELIKLIGDFYLEKLW
ncbi:MAG: sugar phosphate isomerase/epimerase, partial [Clostridia bacterium]